MESKTPQFDSLIAPIIENLTPHLRTCKWKGKHEHCEGEFEIEEEDIKFFTLHQVPPPNYCSTCRRMRASANMNMIRLFKRVCNVPGHSESMISILPPNSPFPIYDYKHYISEEFDALSFGKKYDDTKSPLAQLLEMRRAFPMPSFLNRDPSSINSEYSNGGRNSKNVYYSMAAFDCENIWYCNLVRDSKDVMDSRMVYASDHVYWNFKSEHIYKSSFIYFSKDCTDSMFLFDCRNTDNSFGCVNMRGAKYCVWNKQLTQEAYEEFMQSVYPLTPAKIAKYKKEFWALIKSLPVNASRNISSENADGVLVVNSRNIHSGIDVEDCDHLRYVDGCFKNKDSMIVLFSGGGCNTLYACTNVGSKSSSLKFSISTKFSSHSEYLFNCNNVHNSFMCFGLRDKSYCILNMQYSPEEYYVLLDKIKSRMIEDGEYGDGLGFEFSAQAYNFSLGQTSYPLSDETIVELGGYIGIESDVSSAGVNLLSYGDVPENIENVTEDITNNAIMCEITGKPFRVTPSELQFYKKMKLPIPNVHPIIRISERMTFVPMAKKYEATCVNCKKPTSSVFEPHSGFILYCDKCHQQVVY